MSDIETPDVDRLMSVEEIEKFSADGLAAIEELKATIEVPKIPEDQIEYLKELANKELDQVGVLDETVFYPRDIPSPVQPENDAVSDAGILAEPFVLSFNHMGSKQIDADRKFFKEMTQELKLLTCDGCHDPKCYCYGSVEHVVNESITTAIENIDNELTATRTKLLSKDVHPKYIAEIESHIIDLESRIEHLRDTQRVLLDLDYGKDENCRDEALYDNCSCCGESMKFCICPKIRNKKQAEDIYYAEKGCATNPYDDLMEDQMVLRLHQFVLMLVEEVAQGETASYQPRSHQFAYKFVRNVLGKVSDKLVV